MQNSFTYFLLLLTFPAFSQFSPRIILALDLGSAYEAKAADLDGDGDQDVVAGFENALVWYENLDGQGSLSETKVLNDNPWNYVSIQLVDLDKDGDTDVLTASATNQNFSWYRNEGGGIFSARINIFTANNAAFTVFAVDLDLDGDMDILTGHAQNSPTLSAVAYLKNNGSMSFNAPVNLDTDNTVDGITAADYDGDGDVDVAAVFKLGDKLMFYQNNGNLSFSQLILSSTLDGASGIHSVDLDGDADLDLLASARNNGAFGVSWFKNLGTNNFEWDTIGGYFQAETIFPADLDGDADPDVLVAGDNFNQIGWFKNEGGGSFSFGANISENTAGAVGIH
ncbi:MAG: VCBS repeat-containing protein, partial [Bacteroidota bacterium]